MAIEKILCHGLLLLFLTTISDAQVRNQEIFCTCGKYAYPDKPFVAVWNSPTGGCMVNFSIPINLQPWGILADPMQHWNSRFVTVFYGAQLGLYPYYPSEDATNPFNGGLPQLVSLKDHLQRAKIDIMSRIPNADYNGLAVIDWEPWRPLWERNWNAKKIYKVKSVELVRQQHPDWPMTDLVLEAKDQFEKAARDMMIGTIRLGRRLRPKALWGFYGFPDCFGLEKYDFQCTDEVKRSNDKIDWLFAESTALFPSIYLLKNHLENPDYVKGRLREASRVTLRLSQRIGKSVLPIFPYFRSIYTDDPLEFNFLDQSDLYNTIGVASEMGCSGVVIWGNRNDENTSPEICHQINTYIQNRLGPFIRDTRKLVEQCSIKHCYGKGHCIHKSHLDKDLRRLYTFRKDLNRNCAKRNVVEWGKRGSVPRPNQTVGDFISNKTGRMMDIGAIAPQNMSQSSVRMQVGIKPINERLNKFQVDLHDQSTRGQSNSSKKYFDQKSQVPSPNHHFSGNLISSHLKHSKMSILPHMYVLITGVAIAGAFLFSLIFVALYYYLNMDKKQEKDTEQNSKYADKKQNEMANEQSGPKLFKQSEESDVEVDLDSLKSFDR